MLIDLYIVSKQIEGRSKKTLDWYQAHLARFTDFVCNGQAATLEDLTLDEARSLIAHLQGRTTRYEDHHMRPVKEGGLSPHSIHAYVRTLKAFGNWLQEEDYVETSPFERLKPPKLPKTMIEILSEKEIRCVVEAINPATFLGARMRAIVLLLLDTGIRASELCGVTLENMHLEEGYVKVIGKGDKERIVPFGGATRKALLRYFHVYRPEPANSTIASLFLSVDSVSLTYSGLAQALRRLGKAAGVPRLHAHLFRHTFAVRYLMNGGDVMTLKLMLGHTSLDVTQMYLHLAQSHVQVQHNKFSPVDRMLSTAGRSRRKRK
ncbi:MAG: tyrosine-type recombinase/integrase [Chloroflexota bacterium]|nr:tyrosine-type recombinase/integrase [Chloroflexota bacterium]